MPKKFENVKAIAGGWRSIAATSLPPYMSSRDTTGISRSVCRISRAFCVRDALRVGWTVPPTTGLTSILALARGRRTRSASLPSTVVAGKPDSVRRTEDRCTAALMVFSACSCGRGRSVKNPVKINRESRPIAHEEIARRAALKRECAVDEDERCRTRQHAGAVEIAPVHRASIPEDRPRSAIPTVDHRPWATETDRALRTKAGRVRDRAAATDARF